ncbi:hypothetical protein BGZ65_005937, partial [Modicella reniformis]
MSKSNPLSDMPTTIQIVLSIPKATIYHGSDKSSAKKLIGTGELRVYSSIVHNASELRGPPQDRAPPTTFFTLETNLTSPKSHKSLITHPLMPSSTAEKIAEKIWRFSIPGGGFLVVQLPGASVSDIMALENLLTDRIVYTNQHKLRNQLALVDDVGQVYGLMDEEVEVEDDDNVSLSENRKSPVVVRAIEPQDDNDGKPLKLKVSVPCADDMADYLTSASQSFGDSLVRGATMVAGGIVSSSAFINSKIPETQKPLQISPSIKNRVRCLTKVSRTTLNLTGRAKSAVISKAFDTGYRALKHWTAKDDPQNYSTMQNFCYSILNSAGIIIQATEDSI